MKKIFIATAFIATAFSANAATVPSMEETFGPILTQEQVDEIIEEIEAKQAIEALAQHDYNDGECDVVEAGISAVMTPIGALFGAIGGALNEVEDAISGTEDGDQVVDMANEGANQMKLNDCK